MILRIKQLDVLRGLAIVLVLGSHMYAGDMWAQIGWVGVDLFFVLSGFLVSGLLFKEYKKEARIKPLRFLIRRGFKIYPAFYVMLLATVGLRLKYTGTVDAGGLLAEIFFLQNYFQPLWWHTWSLAVEEHFYVLLALGFFFMQRKPTTAENPFRHLPKIVAATALIILGLRILTTVYVTPWKLSVHNEPTHLRLDSLLFGVLLAYLHHFHYDSFFNFVKRRAKTILFTSLALCSCCLFFPGYSPFMTTVGFTLLYLGFGGILMISLYQAVELPKPLARVIAPTNRMLSYIGIYSYSIYLWHLIVAGVVVDGIRRVSPIKLHYLVEFFLYAVGSIALGIVMSKIIEQPTLSLRDRLFPSQSGGNSVSSIPKVESLEAHT
jgi:peptidoglycan/LPS O-acetylase OafA/YrhL